MTGLTARQAEVLAILRAHFDTKGYAPTMRELAKLIGVASTNAVVDHLRRLQAKGYIELAPGGARTLRVLRAVDGAILEPAPIVPDSPPQRVHVRITREGTPARYFEIFDSPKAADFAFELDAGPHPPGYLEGDVVFVRRQQSASHWDLVLVEVDSMVLLRHIAYGDGYALLHGHPGHEPTRIEARPRMLGLVVGLLRRTSASRDP